MTDPLPANFQANIDRLFHRLILPGLDSLKIHDDLKSGEASSMEEFLTWSAAQVDNHTANEAAKAFTLVLSAMFERQLRIWMRSWSDGNLREKSERMKFPDLVAAWAKHTEESLVDEALMESLVEMFLVANVFRHGDGTSVRQLQDKAPQLWNYDRSRYVDILPPNPDHSERLLLYPKDVFRYAEACARFWGLVDSDPLAFKNTRYG